MSQRYFNPPPQLQQSFGGNGFAQPITDTSTDISLGWKIGLLSGVLVAIGLSSASLYLYLTSSTTTLTTNGTETPSSVLTLPLDLGDTRLLRLADPVDSTDGVSKGFMEDSISDAIGDLDFAPYLNLDGSTSMTANLNMGTNRIDALADPATAQQAATKNYVDTKAIFADGTKSMTDDLNMGSNNINSLADPTTDQQAATKKYVDDNIGGVKSLNTLNEIAARLYADENIVISCYGDSTTDGNATTGWTGNPTSGGDAVGSVDHNLSALNAWPNRLQVILRAMYPSNSDIYVYNHGYSGKRMDDGWAVSNYQAAVIDNLETLVGTPTIPDVCFIGFGLNDIQSAGSQIDDHITQTELLLDRIIGEGTLPILLTSDASFRGSGDIRDHKEAVREIDSVKRTIALKYGIPIIDIGSTLKNWIQENNDGYQWSLEQADALHFQDNGHALKAQYIASLLFADIVLFNHGSTHINTWDSRTTYVGSYSDRYTRSNTRQHANVLYSTGTPVLTDMMTMWVYCSSPNAYLIYLGIDNEWSDGTVFPAVITTEFFSLSPGETSKTIISTSSDIHTDGKRCSDQHYIHSRLKFGLNKVVYKSGDSSKLFFGGFQITEGSLGTTSNVLHDYGRFGKTIAGSTGVYIETLPESSYMRNIAGVFDGEILSISFSVSVPDYGGVVLLYGQGFDTTDAAVTNNLRNGILLYRSGTQIQIHHVEWSDVDPPTKVQQTAASNSLWTSDDLEGRLEVSANGTGQLIQLYDSFYGGSVIADIDYTTSSNECYRWGGLVGGVYYDSDSAATAGTVEIKELVINRPW